MGFLPVHGILLLVLVSSSLPPSSVSDSRLLPGKPLTVGSTLVSDDGTFALGFFSLSNSTKNHYYVGIWYNNIPKDNVVWIANRATPITDPSSAALAITKGSNLVVSDTKNGQLLWVANISAARNFSDESTGRKEAILDNSGNFILRTSNGVILWQSFDYPTDTLLPGLNFRLTHNSHALQRLISWKDPQDPSPGGFSYGADPKEFLQHFLWNGSAPYWRSIPWNNYIDVGPYMDLINSTIFTTVRRIDDEIFVTFGVTGGSSSTVKIKIDYSGMVNVLVWNNSNMSQWDILQAEPSPECSTYGFCGPFGYCDRTEPIPTCKCIDGFKPINKRERTNDNFSRGCKRKDALKCSHENSF